MGHPKQTPRVNLMATLKKVEAIEAHIMCPRCKEKSVLNEYAHREMIERLNRQETVEADCNCGQRANLIGVTMGLAAH